MLALLRSFVKLFRSKPHLYDPSPRIYIFIDALGRPDEWTGCGSTLKHVSGVQVWKESDAGYFSIYGKDIPQIKLSAKERRMVIEAWRDLVWLKMKPPLTVTVGTAIKDGKAYELKAGPLTAKET